jgi:hypothetical protein
MNRFRRRGRQLVAAAVVLFVSAASGACDSCHCTPEQKEQIRQTLVHLAILGKVKSDCNFTTPIDITPVVFYTRSCFHAGGPPSSEQCAYAVSVLRENNNLCEALYIQQNGNLEIRKVQNVLRQQGNIKVLVVGVDRNNTSVKTDFATEWVAAQNQFNQSLADYATSIGKPSPIVQFVNTNVIVKAQALESGGTSIYLNEPALRTKLDEIFAQPSFNPPGLQTSNFDVVMMMAIDPQNPCPQPGAGGFSSGRRIVIWWFDAPVAGNVDITPAQWWSFANAAYGHEMAHLSGWPGNHYWPAYSGPINGIWVAPETLGWTDTNQNGSVDLLDPNPYDK